MILILGISDLSCCYRVLDPVVYWIAIICRNVVASCTVQIGYCFGTNSFMEMSIRNTQETGSEQRVVRR